MSNDGTIPGGGGEVGGGGGGKSILGGAAQPKKVRASFVGPIYPAPLDENGALREQSIRRGLGDAHLIAVVFPFQADSGPLKAARAELDKKLGQPFFTAYLYPYPDEETMEANEEQLFVVGGGGGGKSILGGVAQSVTYIGQFSAVVPDLDDGQGEGGPTPPPGG